MAESKTTQEAIDNLCNALRKLARVTYRELMKDLRGMNKQVERWRGGGVEDETL